MSGGTGNTGDKLIGEVFQPQNWQNTAKASYY